MNNIFYKISGFILLAVAGFIGVSFLVPQISTEDEGGVKDFSKMTQAEFVKSGEDIFNTKGTCIVCHSIGPRATARCPDLAGIGSLAVARKQGMDALQYLTESLTDPAAYVVEGFGAIMPKVHKPPIALTMEEMKAVIAFLQSQGGEVTVSPTTPLPISQKAISEMEKAARGEAAPTGEPKSGADVFFGKMRCIACHKIGDQGGILGPPLDEIGAIQTEDYLRESILTPDAVIVKGYEGRKNPKKSIMPQHFKENLSDKEVDDLVAYLLTLKGKTP